MRGSWADRLEVLLPALGYAAAVLSGATTSSLGINTLRQQPGQPLGSTWGEPLAIRSDEWFTQAPIELGVLANGSSTHSPLAQAPDLIFQVSSGGFFESLLFLEGNLLRLGPWLPDHMLFAAFRGFPLLIFLLSFPPLLRRLGANRPLSWLAVVLCVAAPATVWWSFMPIRVLSFVAAGSYLLLVARGQFARGRPVLAIPTAALGGLLLARLATYYVPWGLTLGLPLATAVVVYLIWATGPNRRFGWWAVGIGATVGAALLAATWWENIASLRAELSTVYPGLRRSTGGPVPPHMLFGAPGNFSLSGDSLPVVSNQSELSQGFLLCGVWAALLWSALAPDRDRPHRLALWVIAGFVGVWSLWMTVSWGEIGDNVPVLNLVPPLRAAQTLGLLAAVLACLVLSQLAARPSVRTSAFVAGGCALVTGYGVSDLRVALPHLTSGSVWLVVVLTGLLVLAVTRNPTKWWPVLAVAVVTLAVAVPVNPITFGLGDLRASSTAAAVRVLGQRAESEGVVVATDSWSMDALLVANAVPSLTGYQVTGPVTGEWRKLDPTGAYEPLWNRGASYLKMTFEDGRDDAVVTNPGNDVILVAIDACALAEADLDVGYLISTSQRTEPCLTQVNRLRWAGVPNFVYRVS